MKLEISIIWSALFTLCLCQTCLRSPPELELTQDGEENGVPVYRGTLTYDAKAFTREDNGYPISFTTRVHNGILPSPTIRVKQDTIYKITLINNLEPNAENDLGTRNTFHYPNTTNLHTHGLHISPESPSDDVFISVHPGQVFEYTYYIPCNHHAGTNWYHPHHHGATAVQIGGGSVGALIVEDDMEREGLPSWLSEVNELVLVIQGMDLGRWMTRTAGRSRLGDENLDYLTWADLTGNPETDYFYLINDQYRPTICLKRNVWTRLRMVHNDVFFDTELLFGDANVCQVQLLAKDGVYLSTAPRELVTNLVYFTQSSRVDILIKCDTVGTYDILSWDHVENRENMNWIIGYIDVTEDVSSGSSESDDDAIQELTITEFEPYRPRYLEDLTMLNITEIDDFWKVEFNGRDNINGRKFGGPKDYPPDYNPDIDTINEWDVVNMNGDRGRKHPLHIHVNHFQIVEGHYQIGNDPLFTLHGDWMDTVAYDSRIRFIIDTFGGGVVLHCHILEHEDLGKMAVYKVNNGCNATDIECIRANAECEDVSPDTDDDKSFLYYVLQWLFNKFF